MHSCNVFDNSFKFSYNKWEGSIELSLYSQKWEIQKFNIEFDQENYVDSHLSELQRHIIFWSIALQIISI